MNSQLLKDTAKLLFADDKGLLAMDESNGTCNKRFEKLGIPQTVEARRAYRELIVTTPGLGESIGGAILYDETIRQQKSDGTPFVKVLIEAGITPGIKVDTGAKELAGHSGEKVTEGLDGLRDRLQEYFQMGARFAKWRAVIAIGRGLPSWGCIEANAHALARYAALCQEVGLVPVVEPEVIMDGEHTLEQCCEVTDEVLRTVFSELFAQRVALEGMVLKPNMVLPGMSSSSKPTLDEVADATVNCFLRAVPAAVPAIAFLSGGQLGGIGLGPFECDECEIQVSVALGIGIFICPRHPAAGLRDLEGRGEQRRAGTAGFGSSRTLQSGCTQGRIFPGNGEEMTGSKHNHEGNSGDSGEPGPGPYWTAHAS